MTSCSFLRPLLYSSISLLSKYLGGTVQPAESITAIITISEANAAANRATQRAKESKKRRPYIKLDEKNTIRIGKYSLSTRARMGSARQRGASLWSYGTVRRDKIHPLLPAEGAGCWRNFLSQYKAVAFGEIEIFVIYGS